MRKFFFVLLAIEVARLILTPGLAAQFTNQGYTPAGEPTDSSRVVVNNDSLAVIAYYQDGVVIGLDSIKLPKKVTVVDNYTELRALAGSRAADQVVVRDFSYNFAGKSYATIGGTFKKVVDAGFAEDGGTQILGTDNTKWQRQFDGISYYPDWWEVGGYDHLGNPYTTYNAGVGIADDGERIIAASSAGGPGANIVYTKDATYEVYKTIPVIRGQRHTGNNATIRRGDVIKSAIAAPVTAGQKLITVEDGTIFRTGQRGVLQDKDAPNGGQGNGESFNLNSIIGISGNVIEFFNGADQSYQVGDTLFVQVIMYNDDLTEESGLLLFEQLNFDGNKASNNLTYSWTLNTTVSLDTDGEEVRFRDCKFFDTPCENIFASNIIMEDCSYENLNGSLYHVTSSVLDNNAQSVFRGVWGNNANLEDALNGHAEGVITFSSNTVNIFLENCYFRNDVANDLVGPLGTMGGDDENVKIEGCEFKNFGVALDIRPFSVALEKKGIYVSNSKFINCKELRIRGNGIANGLSINQIKITNTKFINTRSYLQNVSDLYLNNCDFEIDTTYAVSTPFTGNPPDYNQPTFFIVRNYDRVKIDNCLFRGPITYNPNSFKYGVAFIDSNTRRLSDGTVTEYRYGQDVQFTNNTIENFKYSLTIHSNVLNEWNTRLQTQAGAAEFVGVSVDGNHIFNTNDASSGGFGWGIFATPGVIVSNNKIYASQGFTFGIAAIGVDSTGGRQERLLGPIVTNNYIVSSNIQLGGGNGANLYNIIFKDNYHTGTIGYGDATIVPANAFIDGNTLIDVALLPALINQQSPVYRSWKEDKDQY